MNPISTSDQTSVEQSPITGTTKLCALIGSPVAHSLSPTIHNAAFATLGLDVRYLAFDVAPGSAAAAIAAVRSLGLVGLSVTMPHKFDIATTVDLLTPQAAALRSCNTVYRDRERPELLWGDSTDGDGFVAGLATVGVVPAGKRIAVLGAGGAGRAVIEALGRHGAGEVLVVNRDADRARSAAELSAVARVASHDELSGREPIDLLVNATSLGMRAGDPLPCQAGVLQRCAAVADLIYHPHRTELLEAAAAAGTITMNGLPMLLHQAALQLTRWLHVDVPVSVLRDAVATRLTIA